jgi:hypothetical protein
MLRTFLINLLCFVAATVVLSRGLPALADCKVHQHDRVVLYSRTDDPDVLLWDSRYRLREYHAASFDEARELLRHAGLIAPGTRAMVESCVPDFVQSPLFVHPDDAIGIVIVAGPHHGERGWVLGTDVRHVPLP